jgi:hypothetical protein
MPKPYTEPSVELSHRAVAILRAVAAHRVTLTLSSAPDLYVDDVAFCDQMTTYTLVRNGFIQPAKMTAVGSRVRAELTSAGQQAIELSAVA